MEDDLGDSGLESELEDLQADNEQLEPYGEKLKTTRRSNKTVQASGPGQAAQLDLQTLDKLSALRANFPTARFESCERALAQHGGDLESARVELETQHQPFGSFASVPATSTRIHSTRRTTAAENALDDSEAESVASIVKHYDQHGFPGGSILAGTTSAQIVEAMRQSGHAVKPPVHTKFDEDGRSSQTPSAASSHPGEIADEKQDESESGSGSEGKSDSGSDIDSESDSGPEVASSKAPDGSRGVSHSDHEAPGLDSESEGETDASDSNHSSDSSESSDSESEGSSDGSHSSDSDKSSDSDDSDDSSNSDGRNDNGAENPDADSDNRPTSSSESDYSDSDTSSDDGSLDSAVGNAAACNRAPNQAIQNTLVDRGQSKTSHPAKKKGLSRTQKQVPPGQGTTATQKRNARRRAFHAAQNAVAKGAVPSSPGALEAVLALGTQDLHESVAAKKAALLQRIGIVRQQTRDNPEQTPTADTSTVEQPVSDDPKQASQGEGPVRQSENELAEDQPEVWRDRIVYRAVECCQDGVELSEPPFPFVQRWDPQQQYFHGDKNKRGGHSKRKQRDGEGFRDEASQSNIKRRRRGGSGYDADYGNDESYTNYGDTTGFDDTILNYDDEQPEEAEEEQAVSQEADEENMPPLPEDLLTLPILHSGEAVTGMVVTWKQWLLSRATNWQPQISSLTGAVVNVLDDNTLKVRLAKRDRNLDHNEKLYDDDGNRVYDKFELPDMDDEGDVAAEQGYRTLDLADMIEPRILSPAPEPPRTTSPVNQPSHTEQSLVPRDTIQPAELEFPDDRVSGTPEAQVEINGVNATQAGISAQHDDGAQSMVSETPALQAPIVTFIPEDRRHEISLMIDDAGFRKDVDPTVTKITDNAGLDLNSPSQQLEEMAHNATLLASEVSEVQGRTSPQLPSQSTSNSDSQPVRLQPFYGFSDPTQEPPDERQVAYPTLNIPPSDTGSLHSGRQVDPDFSIDLGHDSLHIDDPATMSRSTIGRTDDERNMMRGEAEHDGGSTSEADLSDSSIPSLSDMWTSASTIGTKPSLKHTGMSTLKPNVTPNFAYEGARRHRGNSELFENDNTKPASKLAQKLVEKPIEKPTPRKVKQKEQASKASPAPHIKNERASPSPDRIARANSSACSSPFVVPKGSQVVSLLTSSPEPEIEEDYAEDSIDETYKETSMPTGSGWVKKPRARRGVSMPAASPAQDTAPGRFTASQSKQPTDKRTTAALSSLLRAKKKVLSAVV